MNLRKNIEIIDKNNPIHSFDGYTHINYEKYDFIFETNSVYAFLDTNTGESHVEWLSENPRAYYDTDEDYFDDWYSWEEIEYSKYDKNLKNNLKFVKNRNPPVYYNLSCCKKGEVILNDYYFNELSYDIFYYIHNEKFEETIIGETDYDLICGTYINENLVDVSLLDKRTHEYEIDYTKNNFNLLDEI